MRIQTNRQDADGSVSDGFWWRGFWTGWFVGLLSFALLLLGGLFAGMWIVERFI